MLKAEYTGNLWELFHMAKMRKDAGVAFEVWKELWKMKRGPEKEKTKMPLIEKELIMQAVASGWCTEKNSSKTMDVDLAMAITDEILKMPREVALGCATTSELLAEVAARIEVDE